MKRDIFSTMSVCFCCIFLHAQQNTDVLILHDGLVLKGMIKEMGFGEMVFVGDDDAYYTFNASQVVAIEKEIGDNPPKSTQVLPPQIREGYPIEVKTVQDHIPITMAEEKPINISSVVSEEEKAVNALGKIQERTVIESQMEVVNKQKPTKSTISAPQTQSYEPQDNVSNSAMPAVKIMDKAAVSELLRISSPFNVLDQPPVIASCQNAPNTEEAKYCFQRELYWIEPIVAREAYNTYGNLIMGRVKVNTILLFDTNNRVAVSAKVSPSLGEEADQGIREIIRTQVEKRNLIAPAMLNDKKVNSSFSMTIIIE